MNTNIKKILLIFTVISFLYPKIIFAHPGRTASDGCHYCRTNCDSWGVAWNERHCHGGTIVAPIPTKAPIIVTPRPATPTPTRVPTPILIKKITPSPTSIATPIDTPTITPSPTISPAEMLITETAQKTQRQGFWGWLLRLFGRI